MLSDDEFLELLKNYEYSYKVGKIIEGEVVAHEGNNLLVDIQSKACAICLENEILIPKNQNIKDVFKIGDKFEFVINSPENEDGIYYLSHKKVAIGKNIQFLEQAYKDDEIVKGIIVAPVKGGVTVNVMGIKGFVPSSQLKEEGKIGEEIELKILSIDMPQNNFVLSNKKVYSDSIDEVRKEIFEKIELNMVVKGKVVRIADFGAFVDIGGVDGLLPLSQISWKWIDNPSDVLKNDETIDVEIIGIDKDKQRLTLSLKTLEENPWPKAKEVAKEKEIVKGKVTRIKPFGAFVEVYPKVEGLLNKIQIQQYCAKYNKELCENLEIDVLIKKFDVEDQKINLEIV